MMGMAAACALVAAVLMQVEPQELWPGVFDLGALTSFRVGWQFRDQPVQYCQPGVPGNEEKGATYSPAGRNIFMHPAWRGGRGLTFVEYWLRLPDVRPIKLKFSAGIHPSAAARSDGVTFRVFAGPYERRRVLWERHVAGFRPVEGEVDLSEFAGRQVVLGLEVHPGPKWDTGWDWAHWYAPQLVVGEGRRGRELSEAVKRRVREYYQRGEEQRCWNSREAQWGPSGLLRKGRTRTGWSGRDVWWAEWSDGLWRVRYQVDFRKLGEGKPGALIAQGPDGHKWEMGRGFCLVLAGKGRSLRPGSEGLRMEYLGAERRGDGAEGAFRWSGDGRVVEWTVRARLAGMALVLEVQSRQGGAERLEWGMPYGFGVGLRSHAPYMLWGNLYAVREGFFSQLFDVEYSWASSWSGGGARYLTRSDGTYNPVHERIYLTYGPTYESVLPNISNPRSPFLEDMARRPVIDVWGGKFAQIRRRLEELAEYGVSGGYIIIHNWQRAGYDVQYPDVIPANAGLGGDEELRRLCEAAKRLGHRIAVHENYVDFYPDAPSFNERDVALTWDGKWVKAYLHPTTHIQSFLLKPSRAVEYARRFAPEIHRRYGTNAAYLDVHTAVLPWYKVDFDARVADAAKYVATFRGYARLFAFMREAHGGPLTGEGNGHAIWAGLFDGAEAQVAGGENVAPLVAFDLLKVHLLNVNHGMGYWQRWVMGGEGFSATVLVASPYLRDKYRAQEISFGHAGFVGTQIIGRDYEAVREFLLTKPLQSLYAAARPVRIRYEIGGEEVGASEALLRMSALERLHVQYDNGTQVWVNWGEEDWRIGGAVLPQWGWLVRGRGVEGWCARRQGVVCDYVRGPGWIFADARQWLAQAGIEQTVFDVWPEVESFRDLGGGKFEYTLAWHCEGTTRRQLRVFVHFCHPDAPGVEHIAFQDDYAPKVPTTQWQPGKVYRHVGRVTIPERYRKPGVVSIEVGLFDMMGRCVLGAEMSARAKVTVGRIGIRGEGEAVKLEFVPEPVRRVNLARVRQLVYERSNAKGREIDFGPVVCAGAVVVLKDGAKAEVRPVPKEWKGRVGIRPGQVRRLLGVRDVVWPGAVEEGRKGDVVWVRWK